MHTPSHTPGGEEQIQGSELSEAERKQVNDFKPDEDLMERTRAILDDASRRINMEPPDDKVIRKAAQILGSLGESRISKTADGGIGNWLLTEAYINAGEAPTPIFENLLMSVLDPRSMDKRNAPVRKSESEIKRIKKEILELEKKRILPQPEKPADGAGAEEVNDYRRQLAIRHLRCGLGERDGFYRSCNGESLYEILMGIVNPRHPDYRRLYDEIAEELVAGGANVERFLCNLREEQLLQMADRIAESGIPVKEQTWSDERGYKTEDLSISYRIHDLYKMLTDDEIFDLKLERQLNEAKRDHGALQPYVDMIMQAKAGHRTGFGPTHCNFDLGNRKTASLLLVPCNKSLKPGEVLLHISQTQGNPDIKVIVTHPATVLKIIAELGNKA